MANIVTCRFCLGQATNHDHDSCAEHWGNTLGRQVFEHLLWCAGATPPLQIAEQFGGELAIAYRDYLARCKKRLELERQCQECSDTMQGLLQSLAEDKIKILYPGFQITVSVHCTPAPMCYSGQS